MRVLIVWGSQRGGTAEIGEMIAQALRGHGVAVVAEPARLAHPAGFDAVVIGGALYANRWHPEARRFVRRYRKELREVPTWLFSSGPLDDSADHAPPPTPPQVRALQQRIGARGHVTFGGRLASDARGFPASAMAKQHAGDWRNPARVRAWADELAQQLPSARPGAVVNPPARSSLRWLAFALLGWALVAAPTALALRTTTTTAAIVVHATLAPVVYAALAWRYFRGGAREPAPTAAVFAGVFVALDLALLPPLAAALAAALVALTTVGIGWLRSTMPWPHRTRPAT